MNREAYCAGGITEKFCPCCTRLYNRDKGEREGGEVGEKEDQEESARARWGEGIDHGLKQTRFRTSASRAHDKQVART